MFDTGPGESTTDRATSHDPNDLREEYGFLPPDSEDYLSRIKFIEEVIRSTVLNVGLVCEADNLLRIRAHNGVARLFCNQNKILNNFQFHDQDLQETNGLVTFSFETDSYIFIIKCTFEANSDPSLDKRIVALKSESSPVVPDWSSIDVNLLLKYLGSNKNIPFFIIPIPPEEYDPCMLEILSMGINAQISINEFDGNHYLMVASDVDFDKWPFESQELFLSGSHPQDYSIPYNPRIKIHVQYANMYDIITNSASKEEIFAFLRNMKESVNHAVLSTFEKLPGGESELEELIIIRLENYDSTVMSSYIERQGERRSLIHINSDAYKISGDGTVTFRQGTLEAEIRHHIFYVLTYGHKPTPSTNLFCHEIADDIRLIGKLDRYSKGLTFLMPHAFFGPLSCTKYRGNITGHTLVLNGLGGRGILGALEITCQDPKTRRLVEAALLPILTEAMRLEFPDYINLAFIAYLPHIISDYYSLYDELVAASGLDASELDNTLIQFKLIKLQCSSVDLKLSGIVCNGDKDLPSELRGILVSLNNEFIPIDRVLREFLPVYATLSEEDDLKNIDVTVLNENLQTLSDTLDMVITEISKHCDLEKIKSLVTSYSRLILALSIESKFSLSYEHDKKTLVKISCMDPIQPDLERILEIEQEAFNSMMQGVDPSDRNFIATLRVYHAARQTIWKEQAKVYRLLMDPEVGLCFTRENIDGVKETYASPNDYVVKNIMRLAERFRKVQ